MHDIVIRVGTIIDGTGTPSFFTGDLAIAGGRIVEVGGKGDPASDIDAAGLLVTPDWVDVHTHYDGQAT